MASVQAGAELETGDLVEEPREHAGRGGGRGIGEDDGRGVGRERAGAAGEGFLKGGGLLGVVLDGGVPGAEDVGEGGHLQHGLGDLRRRETADRAIVGEFRGVGLEPGDLGGFGAGVVGLGGHGVMGCGGLVVYR